MSQWEGGVICSVCERETDRQTLRQTDKQTDRDRESTWACVSVKVLVFDNKGRNSVLSFRMFQSITVLVPLTYEVCLVRMSAA